MPSTGTLVFNDQKLQAPEMYATESLGVGVSVPTSNLEVVGNVYVSSNLDVGGSLGLTRGSSLFVGDSVVMETSKHDRPIVKYPEIAMTANSSGGYVASASSQYAGGLYDIWTAHDGERTSAVAPSYYYSSSHEIYSTTNGAYAPGSNPSYSTTSSGTAYPGEYVQMQFPTPIKLSYVHIVSASTSTYNKNAPKQGVICGSNDGTTWTTIAVYSGITYPTLGASANIQASTDVAYTYIRLVVTHTEGVGGSGWLIMEEIDYYGYEEGDVSTDVTLSSVYNKPGTEQLEVYYDGQDYTSMPSSVTDKSGNNVTGTPTNVTFDSTWKAFSFDGSGDYIQGTLGNPGGDYVHSVSWWFKPTQTTQAIGTNEQVMWFMGDTWSAGVCSYSSFYADTFYFAWHTYNINCPTTNISQKQWNHACVTYTGGGSSLTSRSIYINGVRQISSLDNTQGQLLNLPANTYLLLGNQRGQSKYFNGSIANFRLFSKALNAEQVKELYDYQKDYFLGSRSSMTLYKGNLGLGVAEPTSRLEIAGNERIQEYPPQAMTGHDTYMEEHGVFKAHWANWYSGNTPTGMYNKQNAVGGQENIWYGPYNGQVNGNGAAYNGGDVYSGTDFAASTTSGFYLDDVNGNRYHGAWTTLEMPYDILLQRIHLYQGSSSEGINSRCITEDGVILGSANGHEWHHVHTFTGLQYGGTLGSYSFDAAGESVTVNATTPYKHYALVTTRTLHYSFTVIIGELIWFGTPAPTTLDDGHLTLGKTLTTPRVSGHAAGAETPRAESLVIHYDTTVDSAASGTTAVDTSGSGNNGTFNGNAVYSSANRTFQFDGAGDYIITTGVPTATGSGNFTHTVSMWFKLHAVGGQVRLLWGLVGENDGTDGSPSVYSAPHAKVDTSGNISWAMWGDDVYTQASGIVANRWYHCVWTYSGGTTGRKMFLDGVEQTFNAAQSQALNMQNSTSRLTIGIYPHNLSSNPLDGQISNFKLWNVALTADEVAREYALGRTGKTLNVTDTAVCLGGTVPRAQLDVRGTGTFDGGLVIKADNLEYARDGGITLSRAGLGTAGNEYSSQPIVLDGGDATAGADTSIRGGAIWSQWGGAQYGIAMRGASHSDTYPYLQTPMMFVTKDKVGINTTTPLAKLHVGGDNFIPTSRSYFHTGQVTKNNGNTGAQTKNYFAVDIANGYLQFQIELRGYCRNSQGNGNVDPFRRFYTIARNLNANASWAHTSGEDLTASGWSFGVTRSGGSTSTQTIYFTTVMPNQADNATYLTVQATVLAQNGSIAHSARIP